jgi:hypothetical protein
LDCNTPRAGRCVRDEIRDESKEPTCCTASDRPPSRGRESLTKRTASQNHRSLGQRTSRARLTRPPCLAGYSSAFPSSLFCLKFKKFNQIHSSGKMREPTASPPDRMKQITRWAYTRLLFHLNPENGVSPIRGICRLIDFSSMWFTRQRQGGNESMNLQRTEQLISRLFPTDTAGEREKRR